MLKCVCAPMLSGHLVQLQTSISDTYPNWINIRHLDTNEVFCLPPLKIGRELNSPNNEFGPPF